MKKLRHVAKRTLGPDTPGWRIGIWEGRKINKNFLEFLPQGCTIIDHRESQAESIQIFYTYEFEHFNAGYFEAVGGQCIPMLECN